MAIKANSDSNFKKGDAFINYTVKVTYSDGSTDNLRGPVFPLYKDNPVHKLLMDNPDKAVEALSMEVTSIGFPTTAKDMKGKSL